ncbi:hypothetical protein ACSEE7_20820 [Halomonas cupida]
MLKYIELGYNRQRRHSAPG